MKIMWINQKSRSDWRFTTEVVRKIPEHYFLFFNELEDNHYLSDDLGAVVILGSPESTIRPEQNYWRFLEETKKRKIPVVGILTSRNKRTSFPENNRYIDQVVHTEDRTPANVANKLQELFKGYESRELQ